KPGQACDGIRLREQDDRRWSDAAQRAERRRDEVAARPREAEFAGEHEPWIERARAPRHASSIALVPVEQSSTEVERLRCPLPWTLERPPKLLPDGRSQDRRNGVSDLLQPESGLACEAKPVGKRLYPRRLAN